MIDQYYGTLANHPQWVREAACRASITARSAIWRLEEGVGTVWLFADETPPPLPYREDGSWIADPEGAVAVLSVTPDGCTVVQLVAAVDGEDPRQVLGVAVQNKELSVGTQVRLTRTGADWTVEVLDGEGVPVDALVVSTSLRVTL